jgi:hypothetical protein
MRGTETNSNLLNVTPLNAYLHLHYKFRVEEENCPVHSTSALFIVLSGDDVSSSEYTRLNDFMIMSWKGDDRRLM